MSYQHPANAGGYGAPTPGPRPAPPGAGSKPPWWKLWWVIAIAALVLGVIIGAASAGGSSKTKTTAGPTTTATVSSVATVVKPAGTVTARPVVTKITATKTRVQTETYTPPPPPTFSDGTYQAGSDIKSGRYHTTGGSDCYYEVTNGTGDEDIVDNGDSTGPQYFRISGDQYVQLSGGCDWAKVSS